MLEKSRRIDRKTLISGRNPSLVIKGSVFSARVWKSPSLHGKFSFSVSKTKEKKAVLRNKVRRIGYEAVRELGDRIPQRVMVQFILISKPANLKDDIVKDVSNILQKINDKFL